MTVLPTGTGLPTGTVTLLFTDVEGSTRLLARLGTRYAEVVTTQRQILRAAIRRWGGHELGTEGDSFFVVFPSARDAVCAVRDAQLDLAHADWPDGEPVRLEASNADVLRRQTDGSWRFVIDNPWGTA